MGSTPETIHIRLFDSQKTGDYEAVVKICEETSHASSVPIRPLIPWIYAIPYVKLEPSTAFVLEATTNRDESPRVVGYIIGTLSTRSFVSAYLETFLPSLPASDGFASARAQITSSIAPESRQRLQGSLADLYNPSRMLFMKKPEFLDAYPAHLHIDIAPGYTGKGYGQLLMKAFLEKLRSEGVEGVHLGMADDNDAAGRFYQRLGFEEAVGVGSPGAKWFVMKLQ